jgi:hypothetical protein
MKNTQTKELLATVPKVQLPFYQSGIQTVDNLIPAALPNQSSFST